MIFLRHPRLAVAPGICYGRMDFPLTHGAPAEIAAAVRAVEVSGAIRTSPAARCLALATALSDHFGLPAKEDPRLLELDFGDWEGRPWDGINRAESDLWAADPWTVAPPGGETFALLYARVAAALAEMPPDSLVVTHAGPIRAARMILAGASFHEAFAMAVPHAAPLAFTSAKVAADV